MICLPAFIGRSRHLTCADRCSNKRMKKLLIIYLMMSCFSPAFAQWGKAVKAGAKAWRNAAAATEALRHQVGTALERKLLEIKRPANPYIQIENMPGKPFVKLGTLVSGPTETNVRQLSVLPARAFNGIESHKILLPEEHPFSPVYVPVALNTAENVGYRGIYVYDLKSVQNLLKNGLEYDKVATLMKQKIYFSNSIQRAAWFAAANSTKVGLPVLIKFTLPEEGYIHTSSYPLGTDYYYSSFNIPADCIRDVMILLETDGVTGWYKAVLEKGKLTFIPVPGRLFKSNEMIEHDIKVPTIQSALEELTNLLRGVH